MPERHGVETHTAQRLSMLNYLAELQFHVPVMFSDLLWLGLPSPSSSPQHQNLQAPLFAAKRHLIATCFPDLMDCA